MTRSDASSRPYILQHDAAPAFWLVGTLWLPLATGVQTANKLALLEQSMPTGLGPPAHRHPFAAEGFYVLGGTCVFNADGRSLRAGPGTFVHIPRRLPHSFSVETADARVLNFYTPAGFEMVVIGMARPAESRERPAIEDSQPGSPEQLAILSRLFGQEAVKAMPFRQPSEPAIMATEEGDVAIGEVRIARATDAPIEEVAGVAASRLAGPDQTGGGYALHEVELPAGRTMALPPGGSDHAVYLLDGSVNVNVGDEVVDLTSGGFAWVPGSVAFEASAVGVARLLLFEFAAHAGDPG